MGLSDEMYIKILSQIAATRVSDAPRWICKRSEACEEVEWSDLAAAQPHIPPELPLWTNEVRNTDPLKASPCSDVDSYFLRVHAQPKNLPKIWYKIWKRGLDV